MPKKVKELLIIFAILLVFNELFTLLLIPYGFTLVIQLFTLVRTLIALPIFYVLYIVIKKYWKGNKEES